MFVNLCLLGCYVRSCSKISRRSKILNTLVSDDSAGSSIFHLGEEEGVAGDGFAGAGAGAALG